MSEVKEIEESPWKRHKGGGKRSYYGKDAKEKREGVAIGDMPISRVTTHVILHHKTLHKVSNIIVQISFLFFQLSPPFKPRIGTKGRHGLEFTNPQGLCALDDGGIAVADSNNSSVQIFDADGNLGLLLGVRGRKPGNFQRPTGKGGGVVFIGKKVEVSLRLFDIFKRNRVFIFLWESWGTHRADWSLK